MIGTKPPLQTGHVWSIRAKLQIGGYSERTPSVAPRPR